MKERTPDEIMADYLLKRGKMLSKTCPDCGSPLFDYHGEVFCVVCRERNMEKESSKNESEVREIAVKKHIMDLSAAAGPDNLGLIEDELVSVIIEFCRRVKAEKDAEECLLLMKCIEKGASALKILRSPVNAS